MKASHTLTVNKREKTGSRYAARDRAQGLLPTVLYGRGKDPVHITLNAKEALKFFNSGERLFTIALGNDASVTQLVMLKDVQFNYLGDEVVHADLVRVELDDVVEANVHIRWTGDAKGLKTAGAVMMHIMDSLHVQGKVRDMPEEITVDVSEMGAGDTLHVSDITVPEGLTYMGEPEDVVASITIKAEQSDDESMEGAEMGGASGEPEVITEKKEEKED